MNLLNQFDAIFKRETRSIAKITVKTATAYMGKTSAGNLVQLRGNGFSVGDNVFYDRETGDILETAPNLDVVELVV